MTKKTRITTNTSESDVAAIKGMLARGDRTMDIGAYFGINQARVSEIKKGIKVGKRFRHVLPAPLETLPPPGPYIVVSSSVHARAQARAELLNEIILLLQSHNTSDLVRNRTV